MKVPVAKNTTVNVCCVPSINSAPVEVKRLTLSCSTVPGGNKLSRFSRSTLDSLGRLCWLNVIRFATFDSCAIRSTPDGPAPITSTFCSTKKNDKINIGKRKKNLMELKKKRNELKYTTECFGVTIIMAMNDFSFKLICARQIWNAW